MMPFLHDLANHFRLHSKLGFSSTLFLVLALTVLTGQKCDLFQQPVQETKPQTLSLADSQKQRYPDLQTGRFLCLADFESTRVPGGILVIGGVSPQGGVPQPSPVAADTQPADTQPTGEPATQPVTPQAEPLVPNAWISRVGATGQHSLAWQVVNNRDALRIGELKRRDWSAYSLLLLNIYSTQETGAVSVEIPSSRSLGRSRFRSAPVSLLRGWNLLRIELSEVANVSNLDDIGAIWLIWHDVAPVKPSRTRNYDLHPDRPRTEPPAGEKVATGQPQEEGGPRVLLLDDVILADNTRWVLGSPEATSGTPVTYWRGTHLWVGVKDVQEFGLLAGRITHLYDLKNDPNRALNLAGEAGLGPIPLPISAREKSVQIPERLPAGILPPPTDPAEPWLSLGADVTCEAKILEATRLRTVIETGLKFRDPHTGATEPILWRYWFYPDGRLLVALRLPGIKGPFNLGGNALAWTTSEAVAGRATSHPTGSQTEPTWCWRLVAGTGEDGKSDQAGLLVVGSLMQTMNLLTPERQPGLLGVWAAMPSDGPVAYSQAFYLTRPPYGTGYADRLARASALPLRREVLAGRVAAEARWDVDHDGFAEMEGVYNFDPADGRLQVRLSSPDEPREPVYVRVRNVPQEANLHVALDGQLLFSGPLVDDSLNVTRDADGQLLIRLPRPVSGTTELEVRVLP